MLKKIFCQTILLLVTTCSAWAAQFTASGTYTYSSGSLGFAWTNSNFVCNGPTLGTNTETVSSLTPTSMVWPRTDGDMTWTRASGTAGDVTGSWTFIEPNSGSQFTAVFNANGTVSVVGNITMCGSNGAPTIASFNPSSGVPGTFVTINGTNFSPLTSDNIVKFNGVTAAVKGVRPGQLYVLVPNGAASGTITVTNAGNTAVSTQSFTVGSGSPSAMITWGGVHHRSSYDASGNASEFDALDVGINSYAASLAGMSLTVAGPGGFSYSFTDDDIVPNLNGQLTVYKKYTTPLASGVYTYTFNDGQGHTSHRADTHVTRSGMQHVDSATIQMQRKDSSGAYRISWAPLNDSKTYYYRVRINRNDANNTPVYDSTRAMVAYADIPAGMLFEESMYKIRVEACDSDNGDLATVRSDSAWKLFAPQQSDYDPNRLLTIFAAVNNRVDDTVQSFDAVLEVSNPAAVTSVSLSGPAGFTSYNFNLTNNVTNRTTSGTDAIKMFYKKFAVGTTMPTGLYTFTYVAYGITHTAYATLTSPVTYPVVDAGTMQAETLSNGNVRFSWANVNHTGALFYRVVLTSGSGTSRSYMSPRLNQAYADIPASIITNLSPASWRVEVFDSSDTTTIRNRFNTLDVFFSASPIKAYDSTAPVINSFRVRNMTKSNGANYSHIGANGTSSSSNTLTELRVTGPGDYDKDLLSQGTYSTDFNVYLIEEMGAPASGLYTLTAKDSAGKTATRYLYMPAAHSVPPVDYHTIHVDQEPSGDIRVSWAPVVSDVPLWYQGHIFARNDLNGDGKIDRVYPLSIVQQSSILIPNADLANITDQNMFLIRAFDGSDGPVINNYSQSVMVAGGSQSAGLDFSTLADADNDGFASNVDGSDTDPAIYPFAPGAVASDTQPPSVPTTVTATPSGTQINIAWAASSDNVGVTFYKVYRDGILAGQPAGGTNTFWPDTSAKVGTTYSYTVAACDAAGNCSEPSTAVQGALGDTTAPVITAFSVFANSNSLTVPLLSFSAMDNDHVNSYCLTETNSSTGCSWQFYPPSTFTFTAAGTRTLYAFAQDVSGNISAAASTTVVINTTAAPLFIVNAILPGQTVIKGETAEFALVADFRNGYASANGLTFSLTGNASLAAAGHFTPVPLKNSGGVIFKVHTAGLAPGSYSGTIIATDGVTQQSVPISLQVTTVSDIKFYSGYSEKTYLTSKEVTAQGEIGSISVEAYDGNGKLLPNAPITLSSDNPQVLGVYKVYFWGYNNYALDNGTANLVATTPDGFTKKLSISVAVPDLPKVTSLTLNPATITNKQVGTSNPITLSGAVAKPAGSGVGWGAEGYSNGLVNFNSPTPGWDETFTYFSSTFYLDPAASYQEPRSIGLYIMTTDSSGSYMSTSKREAMLTITNDPTYSAARIAIRSLQPSLYNYMHMGGTFEFYHPSDGTLAFSRTVFEQGGTSLYLGAIEPGSYKIKYSNAYTGTSGLASAQWYPNGSDIDSAAVVNFAAGGTTEDIYFFSDVPVPIQISGFSPAAAGAGSQVVIYGASFDSLAANNSVTFNGVAATVTFATANVLAVTVPAGVASGPITVTNAHGTVTTSGSFTVTQSATFSDAAAFGTAFPGARTVDFENINTSAAGKVSFSGTEYSGQGITFTTPSTAGLWIYPSLIYTWPSNYLSPGNAPYEGGDDNLDSLTINLNPPATAIGWDFIDLGGGFAEGIRVYAADNTLIYQQDFLPGYGIGGGNSPFWGISSPDKPIARIEIIEALDGDDVAYDNFRFVPANGTGQHTANGTYTYSSGTGTLAWSWTSSDFVCEGPKIGNETQTITSLTATSFTWVDSDNTTMTWNRVGTGSSIVGTWTSTDSTTGNTWTLSFNTDGTVSVAGNIVQCGGGVATGISFTGSVTNTSGLFISGAIISQTGISSSPTYSDSMGNFVLNGLPVSTPFSIGLSASGYLPVYSNIMSSATSLASATPFTFYTPEEVRSWGITTGKGAIRSRVVDNANPSNGTLGGATVTATSALSGKSYTVKYFDGTSFANSATSTYGNGIYLVLDVDDMDTVTVSASKSGWSTKTIEYPTYSDSVSQGRIRLVGPTISYSGGLVDSANNPVVGATVEMMGNPSTNTTTDTNGNFTLTGLPSGSTFTVKVGKSGYYPVFSASTSSTSDILASASFVIYTQSEVTGWGVASGKGAIRTRVVDSFNQSTGYLDGVVVAAFSQLHPDTPYPVTYFNEAAYTGTSTFSNGIYLIRNVDEGDTVTVFAMKPGYNAAFRTYATHMNAVSEGRISLTATTGTPALTANTTGIIFGSTEVNTSTSPFTITFTNSGTANLVVTGSTVTGNDPGMFTVNSGVSNPCPRPPALFQPGSFCTLAVAFAPTASGARSATLTINSNASEPLSISLDGTGFVSGPMVPGAPYDAHATAGNGQATVTFSAPADNGSTITGYTVTSNPAGGIDANAGSTSLSHLVYGLNNGTTYTFTVSATNAIGTGPASAASNSVTPFSQFTVPGAPTGVSAVAGNGQATVSFTPPANNGGAAVTSYTVISSPGNISATGTSSPITITGLVSSTTYTFTVSATNSIGTGIPSAASNSVTIPTPGGCSAHHWTAPPSSPTLMHVAGTLTINGRPSNSCDEVAAFDSNGLLIGVSYVETDGYYPDLAIYGDSTATTTNDEGAAAGEKITFRVWDGTAQQEYNAPNLMQLTSIQNFAPYGTYQGPLLFADGTYVWMDLKVETGLPVMLKTGWNLIGWNTKQGYFEGTTAPTTSDYMAGATMTSMRNKNISEIMSNAGFVSSDSFLVVGPDGVVYVPGSPVNTLKKLLPGKGYWMYVSSDKSITVPGTVLSGSEQMPLNAGWTQIGYWGTEEVGPVTGFACMSGTFDVIVDETGKVYVPGSPVNTLKTLRVNKGYFIHTTGAATLRYQCSGGTTGSF